MASPFFETAQDVLSTFTLLFVFQVVNTGSEEEPNAMSEEKVNFASVIKYVTNLVDLSLIELWIQVEAAELRDEKLQVRPGRVLPRDKVWIQPYTH